MPLTARCEIVPQIGDYDRIDTHWVPYLMSFHTPSMRLGAVSTDSNGFRNTTDRSGEALLTYDRFADLREETPRGVVLGSSMTFGVGATRDRHTVPSVLNRRTRTQWFNFGGRAYNSTQEMLLFLLYRPRKIRTLIVLSGINNLVLSFLAFNTSPVYNAFFHQSIFERAEPIIGVRRAFRLLARELRHKVQPALNSRTDVDREAHYANILACFERDLEILATYGKACGFETCFAFQPVATWIEKALTEEETRLFDVLDRSDTYWQVVADYITGQRERYVGDVRRICQELKVGFCDLNTAQEFTAREWLFVNRVHLTDRGYAVAAEILQGAFGL